MVNENKLSIKALYLNSKLLSIYSLTLKRKKLDIYELNSSLKFITTLIKRTFKRN